MEVNYMMDWTKYYDVSSYGSRTEKSTAARSKPLIAIDYEHNKEFFKSTSEAARLLSLRQGNISACLRGEQRRSGGYTFRYIDSRGVCNGK